MTPSGIVQDDIIDKFYRGKLTFDDIFTCKPLALALQHKNINVAIRNNSTYCFGNGMNEAQIYLKQLGQEDFLKLCSTFGKFLDNSINRIKFSNNISYSELCKQLEELTVKKATYEGIPFNKSNAPLLKRRASPLICLIIKVLKHPLLSNLLSNDILHKVHQAEFCQRILCENRSSKPSCRMCRRIL